MSGMAVKFISAAPIVDWLGFSFNETDAGLVYTLAFDEKHIGNPAIRALHGGAVATFLEVAAQCELAAQLDDGPNDGAVMKTINIDIDYLASSRAQDMQGRASVTRLGRRIAFVEATGWQGDENRPVAKARFRIRIGGAD